MDPCVLLICFDSYYWDYCGFNLLLQYTRLNERGKEEGCRASWKYELTKERGVHPSTSLYPSASERGWVKSFSSFIALSLAPSILPSCPLLPPSLPLCPSVFPYNRSLCTWAQTDISIHVPPRSLATPTNGSMQLACTHSKWPFEYSSANSCIHWYLKCSRWAKALNSRCIWLHLKKRNFRDKN